MSISETASEGGVVVKSSARRRRAAGNHGSDHAPDQHPRNDAAGSLTIGRRLRARREELGVSLRQFARKIDVSASFISQLETGKTRPSAATLYAICSSLNMSIDELFQMEVDQDVGPDVSGEGQSEKDSSSVGRCVNGAHEAGSACHSPVVRPSHRQRIILDSGVKWERLSSAINAGYDIVLVRYEVGGSSNNDGRLMRHVGTECGYVLRGVLEITLGFEKFRMTAGDAISYDSSTPHRLANVGDEPVEAIWFDGNA